eukprot:CAMPEP_0184741532 /NCGR_PEP_ID=MMETSP0315-20130426/4564_1 /TAXON_ID=101924 /ORGANISM="Rhodosorus marinus, Strain UTEX LB 2760" /LENGTH=147 /DNA_ID=CAMNT_0027211885 /DNA_START=63 /DNA_END=506 /DNA_ORIENTATION=+
MYSRSAFVRLTAGPRGRGRSAQLRMCKEIPLLSTDILGVTPTNGGAIVSCEVTKGSKKTQHTVIVGKEIISQICEGTGQIVDEPTMVKYVFDFFGEIKQDLTNTEGMVPVAEFPVNYFSIRQILAINDKAEGRLREMIASRSSCSAE